MPEISAQNRATFSWFLLHSGDLRMFDLAEFHIGCSSFNPRGIGVSSAQNINCKTLSLQQRQRELKKNICLGVRVHQNKLKSSHIQDLSSKTECQNPQTAPRKTNRKKTPVCRTARMMWMMQFITDKSASVPVSVILTQYFVTPKLKCIRGVSGMAWMLEAMCLKNKNISALAQLLIFHIGTRLPTQSSDGPKEKIC